MCLAGDGVTLCVGVHYEASSPRRIALRFQNAGFSDVHITSLTEALIAPAILPRGWLQQQILLAIKEVGSGPLNAVSIQAMPVALCEHMLHAHM